MSGLDHWDGLEFRDFAPRPMRAEAEPRDLENPFARIPHGEFAPRGTSSTRVDTVEPPRRLTALSPLDQLPNRDFAPRLRLAPHKQAPVVDPGRAWLRDAYCRGVGSDAEGIKVFFPGPGNSAHAEALDMCSRCSVAVQCKQFADFTKTEWGIWGGEIRRRTKEQTYED